MNLLRTRNESFVGFEMALAPASLCCVSAVVGPLLFQGASGMSQGLSSCMVSLFSDEDEGVLFPNVPTPLSSSVFPQLWAVTPLCKCCGAGVLLSLVAPAGPGSLLGLQRMMQTHVISNIASVNTW